MADDASNARAASRRTQTTNQTVAPNTTQTSSRVATSNTKRTDTTQKNARTVAKPQQRVVSRTTTNQPTVKPRTAPVITKPENMNVRVVTTPRIINARTTTTRTPESKTSTSARSAISQKASTRTSRAAELNDAKISDIKSLNYSKCRTIYHECMDEFCANKDANLRRCACSARIHEFDNIKKQLSRVEDKMLDFNQRLLTVNLDKEDAAAINVATDGELAFQTKDTSESEKLLQKITASLNESGNSKIANDLSPMSLSLNIETAWDDVDATSGIATSAKSGLDLYNAANPICIEMAHEVCSDEEIAIAQNSYKLTIQQDCDTVAKSYKTQYNAAMGKIHESGALLDIARLNTYQQRNSDTTLTCKKKILNQLSDTSVCGENLYKCLDTSGKYIDPTTGSAFLSNDLSDLANLLKEPGAGEKWSKIQQNEKFVNFLNSKKKFLEPAMAQCQDISDMIWQEFLDDALAQIKLAQYAKLEEIKTSCTKLVAECKTNALKDLSDFDSRALSSFGVIADKTVNGMCRQIEDSCGTLISKTTNDDWETGMTGIATDISYKNIMETCMNVGRNCITQKCNGTSGNFALCKRATDDNRIAILNRDVCWDDVLKCVNGADNLTNIKISDIYPATKDSYYDLGEGDNIKDVCDENDTACYIAKQIWGNCEYKADKYFITTNSLLLNTESYKEHNQISTDASTLLSWFATNTGTKDSADGCNATGCPINYARTNNGRQCQPLLNITQTSDCGTPTLPDYIIWVTNALTNYCETGVQDNYDNCCMSGETSNGICVPSSGDDASQYSTWQATWLWEYDCNGTDGQLCPSTGNNTKLYCVTTSNNPQPISYNEATAQYKCGDGGTQSMWIVVDESGDYYNVQSSQPAAGTLTVKMYYEKLKDNAFCPKTDDNLQECVSTNCNDGQINAFKIKYE